jgi:hypothetical protein
MGAANELSIGGDAFASAILDWGLRRPLPQKQNVPVCSARRGVLTLISVPLNVRSGSVSVRVFGIDFGRPEWFFGASQVDKGWRSSAGRASDL